MRAGNLDVIIILSLDRLARRARLVLDLVDELNKHNVALVSCKESLDTTTAQGQFVITMFAALAQLERDLISERTVAALAERNKINGNIGGRVPFGYVRIASGVEIEPVAAETVRLIFAMRKRGLTLRDIASALNEQKRMPPYSTLKWHHTGVREILLNRDAYRGGRRGTSAIKWPIILKTRAVNK